MYLKEICFISQSVVSDIQPYKSVPGSNRTKGTSEEALANPGVHNPDRTSHQLGNLYTDATQCRDNRWVILSFSKVPGLHHRSSNAIHNVESPIQNGLYDKKVLSRLNWIVSAIVKTYGYGISIKSQLNNSKLTFKWFNPITISNLLNKRFIS